MGNMLEKLFCLKERESKASIEVFAGITTFTAMSYIIFVQPSIMSGQMFGFSTGMDFDALAASTCIAAAFGSILMGLLANYPIGLAPGMGENFFFVLTALPVCASLVGGRPGNPAAWQLCLGVVLVSGLFFALLSFLNVRQLLMNAISPSLKFAIAGGIGIFIALIGLEHGKLIVSKGGHYVLASDLTEPSVLIFGFGMIVTVALRVWNVRSNILAGILLSAGFAAALGEIKIGAIAAAPPSIAPVFAQIDFAGIAGFFFKLFPLIMIFTFMDVFDTLGTLIGVSSQAGLLRDGKLPNAARAFAADAAATVAGCFCGHSTVTSYIESGTGVEAGGRTGLAAVVTGMCFIAAIFFTPLVKAVAGCLAVTAPALVIVGAMMLKNMAEIEWDDFTEAVPAFMILIGIPLTYSIADGMILGFILYPILKLAAGKPKEAGWLTYLLAFILIAYIVFLKNMNF